MKNCDFLSGYDIDGLARSSGWTARKAGKITALEFCSAMIEATRIPNASLRLVAFLSYAICSVSVSKQAIHKRVNMSACAMFEALLGQVVAGKAKAAAPCGAFGFRRVLVRDSTSIALPKHLFAAFRGAGNAAGKHAGLKVHACFELLARRFAGFSICEHRKADQGFSPEGLEGIGEGDLLVQDLGYFNIEAFRRVKLAKGDVLTRWQPHTALLEPGSLEEIDLPALLRARSRTDRQVLVGRRQRFAMRLVAFRVPEEVAQLRRRRLNKMAKHRGGEASKRLLALQGWQIYLTTCDSRALAFDKVYELYRQRWAIELLFKAFKSHVHIDEIPPYASESMVRCLALCALIRIARSVVVVFPILGKASGFQKVSLLKMYSLLEALAFEPGSAYFQSASNLGGFQRHCLYEKRTRISMPANLEALCLG